jgi:hypothetical protein
MIRRLAHMLLLLIAFALAFELADPAFASVRGWLAPALLSVGLAMFLWTLSVRSLGRTTLALAWLAVAGLTGTTMLTAWSARIAVFQAAEREPARMAALGQHLVIGYGDPDDVR